MERYERNGDFQQFRNKLNKSPSPPIRTRHLSSQDSANRSFPRKIDEILNDHSIYGDEQVEHVNLQNSVSIIGFSPQSHL